MSQANIQQWQSHNHPAPATKNSPVLTSTLKARPQRALSFLVRPAIAGL